jgi:hypothetical protein
MKVSEKLETLIACLYLKVLNFLTKVSENIGNRDWLLVPKGPEFSDESQRKIGKPLTSCLYLKVLNFLTKVSEKLETLLLPEGPGFSGGSQLTVWQPPRVSALAACSVAATRSVPVSAAEPTA